MQKVIFGLRKNSFSSLSVLMPIFAFILFFVFWLSFETYIVVNLVRVVRIFKLIVPCIAGVGIVLGVIGIRINRTANFALTVNVFGLIGIILNMGLLYSTQIIDLPKMTGKTLKISEYESNASGIGYITLMIRVDLPASEFVERNLDLQDPIFIVDANSHTIIYEQTGRWSWQREIVDDSKLQPNQHIQVKWDGFVFVSDPAEIEAVEITILNQ